MLNKAKCTRCWIPIPMRLWHALATAMCARRWRIPPILLTLNSRIGAKLIWVILSKFVYYYALGLTQDCSRSLLMWFEPNFLASSTKKSGALSKHWVVFLFLLAFKFYHGLHLSIRWDWWQGLPSAITSFRSRLPPKMRDSWLGSWFDANKLRTFVHLYGLCSMNHAKKSCPINVNHSRKKQRQNKSATA